ncbi:hypothetical protein FKP32DRAFT_987339 [Trametes sanguinea]|nr:hypothetical protein FKP32DRAFT_987339 [Trametes sanguinea]
MMESFKCMYIEGVCMAAERPEALAMRPMPSNCSRIDRSLAGQPQLILPPVLYRFRAWSQHWLPLQFCLRKYIMRHRDCCLLARGDFAALTLRLFRADRHLPRCVPLSLCHLAVATTAESHGPAHAVHASRLAQADDAGPARRHRRRRATPCPLIPIAQR